MNLDDVIKLARRLWPHGFACAYVIWFEGTDKSPGRYHCKVEADQDIGSFGDSDIAACSAVVAKLREIERSRETAS